MACRKDCRKDATQRLVRRHGGSGRHADGSRRPLLLLLRRLRGQRDSPRGGYRAVRPASWRARCGLVGDRSIRTSDWRQAAVSGGLLPTSVRSLLPSCHPPAVRLGLEDPLLVAVGAEAFGAILDVDRRERGRVQVRPLINLIHYHGVLA